MKRKEKRERKPGVNWAGQAEGVFSVLGWHCDPVGLRYSGFVVSPASAAGAFVCLTSPRLRRGNVVTMCGASTPHQELLLRPVSPLNLAGYLTSLCLFPLEEMRTVIIQLTHRVVKIETWQQVLCVALGACDSKQALNEYQVLLLYLSKELQKRSSLKTGICLFC